MDVLPAMVPDARKAALVRFQAKALLEEAGVNVAEVEFEEELIAPCLRSLPFKPSSL